MKTINIKTSELSGAALDYCVAKCEDAISDNCFPMRFRGAWYGGLYRYSSDWAQGGPIMGREGIIPSPRATLTNKGWVLTGYDCQNLQDNCNDSNKGWFTGDTLLIAAMRCYVASKFGECVDVPEELVG